MKFTAIILAALLVIYTVDASGYGMGGGGRGLMRGHGARRVILIPAAQPVYGARRSLGRGRSLGGSGRRGLGGMAVYGRRGLGGKRTLGGGKRVRGPMRRGRGHLTYG